MNQSSNESPKKKPLFLSENMGFIDQMLFEKSPGFASICENLKKSYEDNDNIHDLFISKNDLILKSNFSKEAKDFYSKKSTLVWLDLPVTIKSSEDGKQRNKIMIIGRGPLRIYPKIYTGYDFEVRISTPFSFHKNFMRLKSNTWKIISDLVEDYDLYITDLYKLWMSDGSGKYDLKKDSNIFVEILNAELKAFDPDMVVSFSSKAGNAYLSLANTSKLLESLQPSTTANKYWSKRFVSEGLVLDRKSENKSRYVKKQVKKYLEKLTM